jgi:sterol desaturase/sphingolipid hydroxylase (fatty acid hydroxylase superfamily)
MEFLTLTDIRLLSFLAIILTALTLIMIERILPYTPHQVFFREGFWQDFVFYTLLQSYACGMIISFVIEWLNGITGLSAYKLMAQFPLWVQLIFFVIVHDVYIYWFHRWQHSSPYLWRLHEAHHSNHTIDWLAGSRSHTIEILINQTIEFAPIVLLGASPEVAVIKGFIDAAWGMYIHSNIDVRSGRLQYILNGPEMHRWHHAHEDEAHNKNFSTKLAVWDWMFGTAFLPNERKPKEYGLGDPSYPRDYVRQHLYAFRSFKDE